jgi:hypothetical protein
VELAVVEREPTPVMFVATPVDPADDPEPARAAFVRLETVVGLRSRKFFGTWLDDVGEYRACVAARDGDDASALGLSAWSIPGGRYLRGRIRGEPPGVYGRIGPGFDELERAEQRDAARPDVEFHRRRDEIDLLLPIASA